MADYIENQAVESDAEDSDEDTQPQKKKPRRMVCWNCRFSNFLQLDSRIILISKNF